MRNAWRAAESASVARAYQLFNRLNNLSFTYHYIAMAAPDSERQAWRRRRARKSLVGDDIAGVLAGR